MQTIHHTNKNIHSLFTEFESLYALTSEKKSRQNSLIPSAVCDIFEPLIYLFQNYGDADYQLKFREYHADPIKLKKFNKDNMIVCFSGGKDSVATALYYKELGYNVYLYHLKGINKTYKDEYLAAKEAARRIGCKLFIDEITLKGDHEWIEHPMKNMILANMALQHGILACIGTNIAFGNFSTSTLDSDPFDVCGGDCQEMWEIYNQIIDTIIPGFEINTPLRNFQDTIDILCKRPQFLPYTQSCIGPFRYREYLKSRNEEKYGIQLPNHRCGSCWKCCLEYIIFCDKGIYEFNKEYYKHCFDILQKTLYKETGVKYNKEQTWNHYIFYDRGESHYGKCWG